MLFVDDLGYGDVGFTGHPTTHTPAIDALAYGGKRLTSWCARRTEPKPKAAQLRELRSARISL
jgi:hypothetical protein